MHEIVTLQDVLFFILLPHSLPLEMCQSFEVAANHLKCGSIMKKVKS